MTFEFSVQSAPWKNLRGLKSLTTKAVAAALPKSEKRRPVIIFVSDKTIRTLNNNWRGLDKPTNVLSFPAAEMPSPKGTAKPLGDVILSYGVVKKEAKAQGKSMSHHTSHLIVHGVLHLLGYDHENDSDAEKMERRERLILKRLGISDPYKT